MAKSRSKNPPPEEDVLTNALSLAGGGHELKKISSILELLQDRQTMLEIAEVVSSGGSIETAEMKIGCPSGMLKQWLINGKTDPPDSHFNAFYRFYLAASSEARLAAEASLLSKSPEKWLDRCDPLKQIERELERTDTINSTAKPKESPDAQITYKEFD